MNTGNGACERREFGIFSILYLGRSANPILATQGLRTYLVEFLEEGQRTVLLRLFAFFLSIIILHLPCKGSYKAVRD